MKKEQIKEMEERDAAGYARKPSQAGEFAEWEAVQVWPEYEEGEPEEAIQQTATTGGGTKVIEEALEQAAEIRNKLEGRNHRDSTQDVSGDRQR